MSLTLDQQVAVAESLTKARTAGFGLTPMGATYALVLPMPSSEDVEAIEQLMGLPAGYYASAHMADTWRAQQAHEARERIRAKQAAEREAHAAGIAAYRASGSRMALPDLDAGLRRGR